MIDLLNGIQSTRAALTAERFRLDIISQNIANAQTTRGPDGKPYQRQSVVFEDSLQQAVGDKSQSSIPRIARIEKDTRPGQQVYNPTHPDADARGIVTLPNINIHEEMADMISASRAYEANLAVVRNARTMALQTLAIGKR